jgi:hypothetical protein
VVIRSLLSGRSNQRASNGDSMPSSSIRLWNASIRARDHCV